MKVALPHIQRFKDRHGKDRYYYRRFGRRQRIDGDVNSQAFLDNYHRIHKSFEAEAIVAPINTVEAMIVAYYDSPEFRQLKASTQKEYKRHIEHFRSAFKDIEAKAVVRKVIIAARNKMQDRPAKANGWLRVIKILFGWAVQNEWIDTNPTNVDFLKNDTEGWKPWPQGALIKFARESTGSVRVAFFLALYTGQRRADILKMRWDAIKDNAISVKQSKTGKKLQIEIHPDLMMLLQSVTKKGLTIVQKQDGSPYTEDGFSAIWHRAQHEIGVHGYPFHGLRKNAVNALFEAGCTPQQVMAVTGHTTLEMVSHYGQEAEQKKMAKSAISKWIVKPMSNQGQDN